MTSISRVNQLNRAFTVVFTDAMQSIKPKKDIEKFRNQNLDEQKKTNKTYAEDVKEWQSAFAFRLDLRNYINNLNNILVLAGGPNSSSGRNPFTSNSLTILKDFMNSDDDGKSFDDYMKSCAPKNTISNYDKKLEVWEKKFDFPKKLNHFILLLEEQIKSGNEISATDYMKQIDVFIKDLVTNEDELLIDDADNIGGQEYVVNLEAVNARAEKESDELEKKILNKINDTENPIPKVTPQMKDNFSNDKVHFNKIMQDAKKNQLQVIAEQEIIEKKYDSVISKFEIDSELVNKGAQAIKKQFPQYMNAIAGASIGAILALAIASLLCLGCTTETIFTEGTVVVDPNIVDISDPDPISTSLSGDSEKNPLSEITTRTELRNPATEILESEFIIILISTFVAPVATRVIKDKFDVDITEKQISMVMEDGVKSVTMFSKEADKLRDADGHIPRKYQKTLRDKAFTALRDNYNETKYSEVAASVGSEIFDKAIESAVASGKLESFPLEKKQVEALIKQSINATPEIIEWQQLDPEAKTTFIDGNIRKLLQNTGINGWSYKALENIFDAETNKRIFDAAFILKDATFREIDAENRYLKYTSTAIDAFLERKKQKSSNGSETD